MTTCLLGRTPVSRPTKAAAEADEAHYRARIALRELEEYPDIHNDLLGHSLHGLFAQENAQFPLTSERIKISALEDAAPCSACGPKEFEEGESLSDLIVTTQQRIPLQIDKKET